MLADLLAVERGGGEGVEHTGKRLDAADKVRPSRHGSSEGQLHRLDPFVAVGGASGFDTMHIEELGRRGNLQVKGVSNVLPNRTA